MLAATQVKMSGSEKKKKKQAKRNTYDIFSINVYVGSFWQFHVVVVQNNGKEMFKKVYCTKADKVKHDFLILGNVSVPDVHPLSYFWKVILKKDPAFHVCALS